MATERTSFWWSGFYHLNFINCFYSWLVHDLNVHLKHHSGWMVGIYKNKSEKQCNVGLFWHGGSVCRTPGVVPMNVLLLYGSHCAAALDQPPQLVLTFSNQTGVGGGCSVLEGGVHKLASKPRSWTVQLYWVDISKYRKTLDNRQCWDEIELVKTENQVLSLGAILSYTWPAQLKAVVKFY